MRIVLSTSIVADLRAFPEGLERWRTLARDHSDAVALDPRIPRAALADALDACQRARLRCTEVSVALQSRPGQQAPSALSLDRAERREASKHVADTIEQAARHEVPRVLIYPSEIALRPDLATLLERHAMALRLPNARLTQHRHHARERALDMLMAHLDPALDRADRAGVTLALVGPAPWPHQAPDLADVAVLRDEFRGAPLSFYPASDWLHAARALHLVELPLALVQPRPDAGRLADACTTTLRLPLGCGAIDWENDSELFELTPTEEIVLVPPPDTVPEEIARAVEIVDELVARADEHEQEKQRAAEEADDDDLEDGFKVTPSGLLLPF